MTDPFKKIFKVYCFLIVKISTFFIINLENSKKKKMTPIIPLTVIKTFGIFTIVIFDLFIAYIKFFKEIVDLFLFFGHIMQHTGSQFPSQGFPCSGGTKS